MKNLTRWAPALVVVAASATVASAAEKGRTATLTVTLHASDPAEVPPDVLDRAEEGMAAIYRRIGVTVLWNSSPALSNDEGLHVFVLIPSASAAEQMQRPEGVLGYAPRVTPEVAGRVAYVFYHRAQKLARSKNAELAALLAHVLAHEIGHLLLPYDSHSPAGIMQARWDIGQFRRAGQSALSFTGDQVKLIRATLAAARKARSR